MSYSEAIMNNHHNKNIDCDKVQLEFLIIPLFIFSSNYDKGIKSDEINEIIIAKAELLEHSCV